MADIQAEQPPAKTGRRRGKNPEPRPPLAPDPQPESRRRQIFIILAGLAVIGMMVAIPLVVLNGPPKVQGRTLSDVLAAIDRGALEDQAVVWTEIDDNSRAVILTLASGEEVAANYPDYFGATLVARLEASGIPFETDPIAKNSIWPTVAISLLPVFLILAFLIWFLRRSGVGGAKGFTSTHAEVGSIPTSRFENVVGCDEVVDELAEIVSFLHNPTPYYAAGANIPRGFLLVGPPGTGKTLLARAVAGEAGVPFYAASGSDFTEMFVGVGAARVRDLFAKAKKTGGIVFLDELDSVGRIRSGAISSGGGTDEREGTLNALLVEMDGFGKDANVIVIAATNRPDVLDPALLRAGRFDRQITVPAPDRRGRTSLLALYAGERRLDPAVDLVALARRMPGLTGADIANVVNQAALGAARGQREDLQPRDFDEALATVMMGRARRSAIVPERDRNVTAWHEAGHALVALALPDAHDPVQVTIVPRAAPAA